MGYKLKNSVLLQPRRRTVPVLSSADRFRNLEQLESLFEVYCKVTGQRRARGVIDVGDLVLEHKRGSVNIGKWVSRNQEHTIVNVSGDCTIPALIVYMQRGIDRAEAKSRKSAKKRS